MGQVILNRLSSPGGVTYQSVEATIESVNWEASGISGIVKNDVTFGGITTTQQQVNYPFSFANGITANDFANLPEQTMTFSSASTTGPITLTKNGDGSFGNQFISAQVQVYQQSGPAAIYVVTDYIDANTLEVYYQPNPSQGATLANLTNNFDGPNSNMRFLFADLNGTPDPNLQYIRAGNFEEQTSTTYGPGPNGRAGGSMNTYFNLPANAASIADFAEIDVAPNTGAQVRGTRYYALIFDNVASYVAGPNGVRKIAKIENGNTFINVDNTYLNETWEQAGGSLQFITPFAIGRNPNNAVDQDGWAAATAYPSLAGVNQLTVSVAMASGSINQDAATPGIILTYNIEVVDTTQGFGTNDFVVLELNMDETTIGDAADIETAWANIKYYEVLGDNQIRFFAPANSVTDVPIIAKVIK